MGFSGGQVVKTPPANGGDGRDVGSIPGSGRSPGVENGNPLQYSCLENPWTDKPGGPWGHKESDMPEHTGHIRSFLTRWVQGC